MSAKAKRVGIVLAGGESSRFDGEKAFAVYQNRRFYKRIVDALSAHVDQTILVSRSDLTSYFSTEENLVIIEDVDVFAGKGPLAGIYSAMMKFPAEWYVVMAVDMPLLDSKAIESLIQFQDNTIQAVVPIVNDRIQPLAALYQHDCFPSVYSQLQAGQYRMMNFLSSVTTRYVDALELGIPIEKFSNINDDPTYQALRKED
ncbi:molybdenum cofactor guanylyltransferase [Alkalicoccobacillus murimartini]|uniref:Probable molybdenum cofactor guanylyltransferase n=1 Tax=Alkalicoccobacillus murimartini TaxID=171685 RepID=A0ABT9YMT3_9BACI|nr:molybdenum cofactor guanylyltransferase [Alkalicoccobacillus murimartini]MDQ0208903.1 molybdopterin-guanine dinucleotide biosynthesis protein A [Alkalicoccobacillus murimartini]